MSALTSNSDRFTLAAVASAAKLEVVNDNGMPFTVSVSGTQERLRHPPFNVTRSALAWVTATPIIAVAMATVRKLFRTLFIFRSLELGNPTWSFVLSTSSPNYLSCSHLVSDELQLGLSGRIKN